MKRYLTLLAILGAAMPGIAKENDYSDGVFFINEDWYGHQNSSINFLHPDDPEGNYWEYRVFSQANPGHELGCTNQYGCIFDGRLFCVAKQDRDPGSSVTGGRITVADAKTLKMLHQSQLIDPSGALCDGRAFIGLNPHKGYISTSHGVWGFNLDTYRVTGMVTGMVTGTENPNGHTGSGNTDSSGSLYHGQCGMMAIAAGRLFVAHQQYGMLVVDTSTDAVDKVFTIADKTADGAGIGSIVLARDGSLWLSVTKNTGGLGEMLPCLLRVEPADLSWTKIDLPDGIYPPASSWYAWTPDAFCASAQSNALYWNGGPISWFASSNIYKYDIDAGTCELIIDLNDGSLSPWKLYGCSMRVHPDTDELYMSLFHQFGTPSYLTRRCDADGNTIKDYPMIDHYWFPSLPVFATPSQIAAEADPAADLAAPRFEVYGRDIIAYDAAGLTLSVCNMVGQTLVEIKITSEYQCAAHDLPHGIYIVRLGSQSRKVRL